MNPNDPDFCPECGELDFDRHVEQMPTGVSENEDDKRTIEMAPGLVLACRNCGWAYRRPLEDEDPETADDIDHPDMSDTWSGGGDGSP